MALYHCHVKLVQRSKSKSVVAAAAYRSGTKITNEWDGELHDYTKKHGIVHAEILLPSHAPSEFLERKTLWNSVEPFEKQSDAQLARDIEIALPVELDKKAQLEKEMSKRVVFTGSQIKAFLYAIKRGKIDDDSSRKGIINIFLRAVYLWDNRLTLILNGSDKCIEIDHILLDNIESHNANFMSSSMVANSPAEYSSISTKRAQVFIKHEKLDLAAPALKQG